MPVQVSYPGVYIDEQPSGSHAITPVSTSVTAFIGRARRGRLNIPTRVTSLARFQALYGNDASMGELVPQVGQFFLNGGSTAWIMRIANGALAAAVTLNNEAGQPVLRLTANDAGEDGNLLRAEVDLVEVLNARNLRRADDEEAVRYAQEHGLAMAAGSDAHSPGEFGNTYLEMEPFDGAQDFPEKARRGRIGGRHSTGLVHLLSSYAKLRKRVAARLGQPTAK